MKNGVQSSLFVERRQVFLMFFCVLGERKVQEAGQDETILFFNVQQCLVKLDMVIHRVILGLSLTE